MQINANSLSLQAVNFQKMKVFATKHALNTMLATFREEHFSLGFVPTMGALHQGHLSLIQSALKDNDCVVVSIFVNPTQFNNASDLDHYPRALKADLEKLKTLSSSKIVVYAPESKDIYGETVSKQSFNFDGLEHQMEGKFRPGHFDGVGTVVQRLFEIVQPNNAYFGEKDFQQLAIIRKLVELTKFPVKIVGCPIAREKNGLAMSSRNVRLTEKEQVHVTKIFRTLKASKEKFGTEDATKIKEWVVRQFEKDPILTLEYFEISNELTLEPMGQKQDKMKYRAFIAAYVREVRLIDNIALN
jgi:pantoate--beta-alanine ligase